MKKIINIVLVFALLTINLNAEVLKICSEGSEVDYFPMGDETGKSILLKKEVTRECNVTMEAEGPCTKWEEKETYTNLTPTQYNTYQSYNHEDSMGELMAVIGAYDQIGHFWSGWRGYCEDGFKTDFDWASDPMFWGSLAASAAMSGGLGDSVKNGIKGAGETITDFAEPYVKEIGLKISENFGKCTIAAGLNLGKSMYHYFSGGTDIECNPVDEFCEDKTGDVNEEEIMTIEGTKLDELMANDEFKDYITEIPPRKEGIATIKFKKITEMEGMTEADQKKIEDAKQKMEDVQFLIEQVMLAAQFATCLGTGGTGITSNAGSASDGTFSVKKGLSMGINMLPAEWLGPYGPLMKAFLAVGLEFATSFTDINSCKNEDDAKEAGSRHEKTQQSLKYNLCQPTLSKCETRNLVGKGCLLKSYQYCCYDQLLTKVLVSQIKAQLGRDWTNCTGITLDDLSKKVSFRQCTAIDKEKGFDGTKVFLKYNDKGKLEKEIDWTGSYQYKQKCIDLGEFKENLESTLGQEIDFSDFDSIFGDLKNNKDM